LTLTGRYLESEKSTPAGIFENIGIARAAYIERLLEKLGIDESRIHIDHQIVSGQTLHEPVAFSLNTQKPDDYQKLEYRFEDNTFSDANFAFNSAEFIPGDAFLLYADSVKSYLADHPEKILSITGHTDSIDTEKYNYNLGLMRAKSAAQYFRELGVKAKIITNSKGETQPVAPNSKPDGSDNPEGRQKNRRVNFKITDADMNQ
ncbi:MAG TPA: OmpA family protein, partial [Bacteroidetes bacterium]|nr:OmpA family protein [Bacteroidota bacterium]